MHEIARTLSLKRIRLMESVLMIFLTILLFMLDPAPSTSFAARAIDARMEPELLRICRRESRCRRVGIHDLDSWASHVAYTRAVGAGWLHPICQPEKSRSAAPGSSRENRGRWSSRGSHGLMAAYHLRFLVVPCLPPEFSAIAAAKKLNSICKKDFLKRHPREVSWGRCDWRK
jgi:hypothetical protein